MNAGRHVDQVPAGIERGDLVARLSVAARKMIPIAVHLVDGEIIPGFVAAISVRDVTIRATARGPLIVALDAIASVRRKDGRPWWPAPTRPTSEDSTA